MVMVVVVKGNDLAEGKEVVEGEKEGVAKVEEGGVEE